MKSAIAAFACWLLLSPFAAADPCGMVPPVYIQDNSSLVRVGDQQTYVFYKDGVETFVIRPGFEGKVEEFGMLIPFPAVPAVRKAPDSIFPHIQAAIDPPEVVVYAHQFWGAKFNAFSGPVNSSKAPTQAMNLQRDEVRVLKEEAVGMYEVAVLEAGSAAALKRWMDQHKYKYPSGMDKVCEEYVEDGWCFVAVKTRVGGKSGVDPQPGMREVNDRFPKGATFDGHVQAMGFRFATDELVVPMRLSAFNEGELHNIVYILTDGPRRVRSIPEEYVVRQVSGEDLYRNVTELLPVRVIGGTVSDIPQWQLQNLPQQRDPGPKNGHARVLFAADVLAAGSKRLSHPHEEAEKALLNIGERLGLRGGQIDKQHQDVLKKQREKAVTTALADLKKMTLTVLDGDFPREVLSSKNLHFAEYKMPAKRNRPRHYDAKIKKPQAAQAQGVLIRGEIKAPRAKPAKGPAPALRRSSLLDPRTLGAGALALALLGLALASRRMTV